MKTEKPQTFIQTKVINVKLHWYR